MRNDPILRQLEQEWQAMVAARGSGLQQGVTHPGWERLCRQMRELPFQWRPAALFAELEDVQREWQDLRGWKALRRHADRYVNPGWTYKDLLAHLASWSREFLREVETVARGEEFDYQIMFFPVIGPTEWNEREVAQRREKPLEEVFDEYAAAAARLQEVVLEVPRERLLAPAALPIMHGAERMPGNIPRLVVMKCFHDRYHFAQIRTRLAELLQQSKEARQS